MKHFRGTAWLTVLLLLFTTPAMAYTPYQNYTYDYNEKSSTSRRRIFPVRTIGPKELGTSLNEPQDLFIKGDRLYIADTGHNRILITDLAFQKTEILESFQHEGKTDTFKKPGRRVRHAGQPAVRGGYPKTHVWSNLTSNCVL